jgi:hypothetical protein
MAWLLSDIVAQYIYIGVATMYFFRFATRFLEFRVAEQPEWADIIKRWMPYFTAKDLLILAIVMLSIAATGHSPVPRAIISPWARLIWVFFFVVLSVGTIGELTELTMLWWRVEKRKVTA